MSLLLLFLLQTVWGGAAFSGSGITQQSTVNSAVDSTVKVTLELIPDTGLLISRLNPPEVFLQSPWNPTVRPATVSGEPWTEHPDIYFSHVAPVSWTLEVPANTSPGLYKALVTAKLGLCNKDDGFCFVRDASQTLVLTVDGTGNAEVGGQRSVEVILEFHAPSF